MKSSTFKRTLSAILAAGFMTASLSSFAQERSGTVIADSVNLRKDASTESTVLCALTYNTSVTILDVNGDFYKVRYGNVTGYIATDYLQDSDPTGHIGLVQAETVNMRKGPAYTYDIVRTLSRDDQVMILGVEGEFYKVSFEQITGYIHQDYIWISTDFFEDNTAVTQISKYGYVTTNNVNIRADADATSAILYQLKKDTKVYVTERINGYYKVQYNGRTGYILEKYITFNAVQSDQGVSSPTVTGNGIVISDTVNMREKASTSSGIMYTLTYGTVVRITGTEGDFYKVTYNNRNGYIVKAYLSPTSQSTTAPVAAATATAKPIVQSNGKVNSDTVNMREKASTTSGIMYTLPRDTVVKITAEEGDFYKVTYNGRNGYIMKQFLTLTNQSTSAPVVTATATPKAITSGNGRVNTDTVNMREKASTTSGLLYTLSRDTVVKITGAEGDFYKVTYSGKTGYVMKQFLTLTDQATTAPVSSATATPKPVTSGNGRVNTDTVNMREKASTTSGIMYTLTRDTVVRIIGSDGDFYKVTYSGKTGYIVKQYLTMTDQAVTVSAASATATSSAAIESNGKVNSDTVNMREKAATTSEILSILTRDTVVKITGAEGDFYKVSYNGKTGYIIKQYLSITTQATTAPVVTATAASRSTAGSNIVVTADSLNMRAAASSTADILCVLEKGTVVRVNAENGEFYKITYNGKTGYVAKRYTSVTTQAVTTPKTATATPAAKSTLSGSGRVTGATVNVRSAASTSSDALFQLAPGTIVNIKGTEGNFYKITYNAQTGYIAKAYLTLITGGSATTAPTAKATQKLSVTANVESYGKITAATLNIRSKASSDSDIISQVKSGESVYVYLSDGDFYKIKYNGKIGYVAKQYVQLISGTPSPTKTVTATPRPSSSAYAGITTISGLGEAPGYLYYGDSGTDVEKLQQALKIKGYYAATVNGKFDTATQTALKAYQQKAGLTVTGRADYATILKLFGKVSVTSVADDPKMKGITQISQITVPATSKKGDSGNKVIALQQALKIKGYFKAPIDGNYGTITENAVIAYQKARGITQTGEADNTTIKSLFGANAANYNYKTETIDWFKNGDNLIPKRAVFTVKDCLTGKTFKCKRWSGANHCDTEPLTAEDTAIMKSIYGGSWSWARRPILVLYNGHVYAASMNGMPHGTTTISTNNFDGHFCIHFTGSMTHGSKKVDPDHQAAIKRAMTYTW